MIPTEAKRILMTGVTSGIVGAIACGIADISAASHSLNFIESAKILFEPINHSTVYPIPL